MLGRSVQTITGVDNTDQHRPSSTAIRTDRWSQCRRSECKRSSDADAVRTSKTQSMYRVEPNRTDTNRQRNIFHIRDTTSFRCVYILNFFTKTSSRWVILKKKTHTHTHTAPFYGGFQTSYLTINSLYLHLRTLNSLSCSHQSPLALAVSLAWVTPRNSNSSSPWARGKPQ